jgi:hypothetical protein
MRLSVALIESCEYALVKNACVCAVLVDKHPFGIILKSNTVKGIRFSILKEHWRGEAVYARLPDAVIGAIDAWGGRSKADNKIVVEWETDGKNSVESLEVLLKPCNGFKLLPYLNGRGAPKPKGASANREYSVAISTGPYATEEQTEARTVEVPCRCPLSTLLHRRALTSRASLLGSQVDYVDQGGRALVQIWDVRGPQFVKEDWRPGERFRAQINLNSPSKYNTLETMLFNVGLFTPFATECAAWMNERLQVKGQKGATEDGAKDWNRPTTAGEVVQSWGYYLALALNPSVPVEEVRRLPLPWEPNRLCVVLHRLGVGRPAPPPSPPLALALACSRRRGARSRSQATSMHRSTWGGMACARTDSRRCGSYKP